MYRGPAVTVTPWWAAAVSSRYRSELLPPSDGPMQKHSESLLTLLLTSWWNARMSTPAVPVTAVLPLLEPSIRAVSLECWVSDELASDSPKSAMVRACELTVMPLFCELDVVVTAGSPNVDGGFWLLELAWTSTVRAVTVALEPTTPAVLSVMLKVELALLPVPRPPLSLLDLRSPCWLLRADIKTAPVVALMVVPSPCSWIEPLSPLMSVWVQLAESFGGIVLSLEMFA